MTEVKKSYHILSKNTEAAIWMFPYPTFQSIFLWKYFLSAVKNDNNQAEIIKGIQIVQYNFHKTGSAHMWYEYSTTLTILMTESDTGAVVKFGVDLSNYFTPFFPIWERCKAAL